MNIRKVEPGIEQLGPAHYRISVRIRLHNKIVERRETVRGSRERARDRRVDLKRELREGIPAGSLKFSFEIFADALKIYREKRGPFSRQYEACLKKVESDLGSLPLDGFPDRFEEYMRLYRVTPTQHGKPRSPASINRPAELVRAVFTTCFALELIPSNPITNARFPMVQEIPRDVTLSDEERQKLIDAALKSRRTAHLADAINYAMQVPIRKSELVNMKIADVDLFSNPPSIRIRNGTTKNDRGTWKPIPPDMIRYFIRRTKEARSKDEPVFGRYISGSRADRTGDNKQFRGLGDFKGAWRTVRTEAGLPDLHFHDTRHVSATNLIDNGTPEQVVMTVAGWKTNMLRTYYHREPRKALEMVQFGAKREDSVKKSLQITG